MRVITGPLVQLGLDLLYPPFRRPRQGPVTDRRRVGIHRRPPGIPASVLPACWPPWPCGRLSRPPWWVVTPTTTPGPPPHLAAMGWQRACPSTGPAARRCGRPRVAPTFFTKPLVQVGGQLYPGSFATPTPQTFSVASPPANTSGFGVDPTIAGRGHALRTGPYPPGWSRLDSYGASPTGSLAFHLLVLLAEPGSSGSADPPRRCRGCFPPFPTFPGSGCPQLLPGCCDSPAVRSHTAHGFVRLVAHVLDVEAAQERVEQPQHVQVGRLGVGVPQPHRLRGPVTGQPVDSHQDQGAFHDRQRAGVGGPAGAALQLRVVMAPGGDRHLAVAFVHAGHGLFGGGPGGRVVQLHRRAVPTRPAVAGVAVRRGVEHPVATHPPEQPYRQIGQQE